MKLKIEKGASMQGRRGGANEEFSGGAMRGAIQTGARI
jgi:hypothetical protein